MKFRVRAVRGEAEVVDLAIEAMDARAATRSARDQGYAVLAVRRTAGLVRATRRGSSLRVLNFTQELVALLEAGLNLVAAVAALEEKEEAAPVRQVLSRLLEHLHRGAPFSQALQEFPQIFPPMYVATVRSNEKTGGLAESLARYARYRLQMDQVRAKLGSALIYPALLFCVGSTVALFLLFYVVPKFRRIFEDMGTDLPFFSRMLVKWGAAVETHGALLILMLAGAVVAIVAAVSRPSVQAWAMSRLLALPAVGARLRIYQYARFYRTLGMLQRSGIALAAALEIASPMLSMALRPAMDGACRSVREGSAVSDAMHANGLTTPIAYRLLRVGEHSGRMPEMLDRIASFHEDQLARWVDWFTRLFEPLLMAAIGVVIGLIVVFLYMPIFELAGSIQ
ncbi:MAG TPA: type II secretion system F family protein [Burkholderiales bacterium]|nr:type II secretion system F family protein [Burkholderiales bacterium]